MELFLLHWILYSHIKTVDKSEGNNAGVWNGKRKGRGGAYRDEETRIHTTSSILSF